MTRIFRNTVVSLLTCSLAGVAIAACSSGKESEPPAPPITLQEAPKPGLPANDEHPPTAAELPIAEDFDEESEQQINADNFRGELDRLEAEINADAKP